MSQMDSKIFDELSVAKKNKTVLTGTVVMVQGKPGSKIGRASCRERV